MWLLRCFYSLVTALIDNGLSLGQVGLCRLNTLFRVVEGMHTPRTVILDLFDDFAGLVDKKHGFRSLFRREFGDFKQLVDTSQSFDVRNWKKLLPENKDQTMVFYCVNKLCTASEMAAREVMKLGYTDVRQMPDGIEGWKLSGRKVERP